ncbi:unnamed protein product, partial [Callosobruchus maculatus]
PVRSCAAQCIVTAIATAIFIDIFVFSRAFSLPQTKGFAFWIANIAVSHTMNLNSKSNHEETN